MILGTGPWPGGGGLPSSLPAGNPQTEPDPTAGGEHLSETSFFCLYLCFKSPWQLCFATAALWLLRLS